MSLPSLEVISGGGRGSRITIPAKGLLVGRDPSADEHLHDDPYLSGRHARFITMASGGALVEDVGSTNGTYVNDVLVTQAVFLSSGDVIRVGDTYLRFIDESQSERHDAGRTSVDARSGGVAVGGGIYANEGAIGAIGRVDGSVDLSRRYEYDSSGLGLIVRSRGAARFLLVLGTLIGFVGFGLFAYPIVKGIANAASNASAADKAGRECDRKFPNRGPAWATCQFEASQKAGGYFPSFTPWLPLGAAVFFVGMVISVLGLFMIKRE